MSPLLTNFPRDPIAAISDNARDKLFWSLYWLQRIRVNIEKSRKRSHLFWSYSVFVLDKVYAKIRGSTICPWLTDDCFYFEEIQTDPQWSTWSLESLKKTVFNSCLWKWNGESVRIQVSTLREENWSHDVIQLCCHSFKNPGNSSWRGSVACLSYDSLTALWNVFDVVYVIKERQRHSSVRLHEGHRSLYPIHISCRTSERILSRLILINRHELVTDLRLFIAITRMVFIWYNLIESTTHQTNTNDLDNIHFVFVTKIFMKSFASLWKIYSTKITWGEDHDHILSQVNPFVLGIDFSRSHTINSSHSSSFSLTEVALSAYSTRDEISCTLGRNLFISITQTSRSLDEWLTSFHI